MGLDYVLTLTAALFLSPFHLPQARNWLTVASCIKAHSAKAWAEVAMKTSGTYLQVHACIWKQFGNNYPPTSPATDRHAGSLDLKYVQQGLTTFFQDTLTEMSCWNRQFKEKSPKAELNNLLNLNAIPDQNTLLVYGRISQKVRAAGIAVQALGQLWPAKKLVFMINGSRSNRLA